MTLDEAKINLCAYFDEACEVLGVDHSKIPFAYDRIGERFRTSGNTCETDGNMLYINEDWIEEIIRTGFYYDFQYQMYHEARHFYQSMVIEDYHKRGKSKELPVTIRQWEAENYNYARNEGTDETQKANAAQIIEIDANAFAIALLQLKGITEARVPEEQWKETEKRAIEIFRVIARNYNNPITKTD